MTRNLDLEQGIKEAIELIKSVYEKPILAAVYGWPDSGKTYLIDRLSDYFEREGLKVSRGGGGPHDSTFETLRDCPECLSDILFFHCGWVRDNNNQCWLDARAHEDPNILAETIAGRKVNLNIGIYNPLSYREPLGDYDLVISNPGSIRKVTILLELINN